MTKKYLLILFLFVSAFAKSQITYTSVMIPMRDGKFLAADYYLPSGCSSCPVILIQTPYQKNWFHFALPLGVGTNQPNSNYAFVIVDWRGFYGSAAALVASPNRGEDGYDVIEWISQQTWCDGNVGTWGPSALGKIQFETAREQHPNHKCAVPLVADPVFRYEDYYPGGVYRTEYVEQLDALGYGLSTFILANQVKNFTWTVAQNQSTYPASINIPMFMIGGWFDHNVDGMLDFFDKLKTLSPVAVRDKHKLLMGPWAHGGSGTASVGSATQGDWSFPNAAGMSDSLAILFFDYYLRGQTSNGWTTFNIIDRIEYETGYGWSPLYDFASSGDTFNSSPIFLNDNGILDPSLQFQGDTTIVYDPRDPSPTVGGPTLKPTLDQGPYDQASIVESRNDIASFDYDNPNWGMYEPILFGKPVVNLFVSTDRKDTDFAVRLTDVDESNGESIILADGIRRLRFRDGFSGADTSVAVPGTIYFLVIDMPHISHQVQSGHHIRLDITSSNYPRFDRNLNNGDTMYQAGDTLIANNTIYYNSANPSFLILPAYFPWSVEEFDRNVLNCFPNPTSNQINISLPSEENWVISITDITGKIISRQNYFGNKFSTDVNEFSKGIYFIRLTNSHNQIYHSRFIKN